MSTQSTPPSEITNPVTALILSAVTCNLYELFVWWPNRLKTINALLGRDEFKYGTILMLSILTCGLMYIYYDYKTAEAILEIRRKKGLAGSESLPLMTVIMDCMALTFITSYMHQEEINKLV
ncbi:MAG: DUF4234 domain-containing protein [Candidatus Sericytochromatia bacterium]|nr:DUF4234 domain-containing protein [Candidatus Sericytochromatia bacterium]